MLPGSLRVGKGRDVLMAALCFSQPPVQPLQGHSPCREGPSHYLVIILEMKVMPVALVELLALFSKADHNPFVG